MQRIRLSNEQKNKIEKLFWKWFKRYHLGNFHYVIKKDSVLQHLIFGKRVVTDEGIKQYLLLEPEKLELKKQEIDGAGYKLKNESIDFLEKRYNNFRSSQAARLINEIDVLACPYCNSNYLNVSRDKNGQLRMLGDFDHFYSKSKYPALQICLYNLIPSCKVCNQCKGNKPSLILNPYNDKYASNIVFQTAFDDKVDFRYLLGLSDNFEITINRDTLSKSDQNEIDMFNLEERYKNLKKQAREIIIKSRIYNSIYEDLLFKEFSISPSDIENSMFGLSEKANDRIMSKFNKDIFDEFNS